MHSTKEKNNSIKVYHINHVCTQKLFYRISIPLVDCQLLPSFIAVIHQLDYWISPSNVLDRQSRKLLWPLTLNKGYGKKIQILVQFTSKPLHHLYEFAERNVYLRPVDNVPIFIRIPLRELWEISKCHMSHSSNYIYRSIPNDNPNLHTHTLTTMSSFNCAD